MTDYRGTAIGVDQNVRKVAFSTGHVMRLPDTDGLEQCLGFKAFELTKVQAMYTSQTCHRCGCIDRDNRPSQSMFHAPPADTRTMRT